MRGTARTAVSLVKLESVEQRHIDDVLRATLGNQTLAAKLLGIDRTTLRRKLKRRAAEQQDEGAR